MPKRTRAGGSSKTKELSDFQKIIVISGLVFLIIYYLNK